MPKILIQFSPIYVQKIEPFKNILLNLKKTYLKNVKSIIF